MLMADEIIRLCTVREAAALLRVHERTVLRWVHSGRLPARRIGRQIRIAEQTIRTCGQPAHASVSVAKPKSRRKTDIPRHTVRKGSPAALLQCAGLMTEAEARELLEIIREAHPEDWEAPGEVPA